MNADRWDQVQTLFKEIIELDRDSRATRLQEIRDTDAGLCAEIESLLAADEDPTSILDGFAIDSIDIAGLLSMEGSRIGPFEIVRQIGSGGMGNVYLATRVEGGFAQQVALKLIKHGMDSRQILSRFESERSILARLEHPNIARLVDGGLTEEGRPWFAMEYVQGEPIDRYCNRLNLSIERRLELFIKVASAVQYAHRNLLVHRDLKPDNIMVSDADESAQIKLLDFGIARLLDDDKNDTLFSTQGIRPMTRAYASPEQLRGEPVTIASDIYSLGIILYELLTGRRPFERRDLSTTEFEDLICTSNPVEPSKIVQVDFAKAGNDRCAKKLQKKLKGDLDVICLKALRREPERRYETVEQFTEDIRRHFERLPVIARPESQTYRTQKFVSRHKTGVAAAGLILLSLIIGVAAFAWQYRVAAAERDRAQREAATAAEVSDFLQGLFEVADPAISKGDTLTARELLDRGAEQIDRELANQPEVQARMLDVLGNVYMSLWLYEESDSMFTKALQIRQAQDVDVNAEIATSLFQIGQVSINNGAYAKADSVLSKALAMRTNLFGENDPETAEIFASLGFLKCKIGDYNRSEEYYLQAIAIFESYSDEKHKKSVAGIKNNLGMLYNTTGEFEKAVTYLRESVEFNRDHFQTDHPAVSANMDNLARALTNLARYNEADSLFQESLGMTRKLFGEQHPNTGLKMNNYSAFLKEREEYEKAEVLQLEALNIFLETLGEDHPYIPLSYNNLGNLRNDLGDYEAAAEYLYKALEKYKKLYGDEHDTVANSLSNLASALLNQGRYGEAEKLYREVLRVDSLALGSSHPYVAMDYQSIGIALFEQGEVNKAEEYIRHSVNLNIDALGENHPNTAIAKGELARVLLKKGEYKQAEALLRNVLELHKKNQPKGSWRTAGVQSLLGECLLKTGNLEEAEGHLLQGYKILAESKGPDHRSTRRARKRLAMFYEAQGEPERANEYHN